MKTQRPTTTIEQTPPSTLLDQLLNPAKDPPALCPTCHLPGMKAGTRTTQRGKIAKLFCRSCARHFTDTPLPRKQYSLSAEDSVQFRTFDHKQKYKFSFHRLKTNIFCKRQFPSIRRYLWKMLESCPHELFQRTDGNRCSDGNLPHFEMRLNRKDTNATKSDKLGTKNSLLVGCFWFKII